MKKFMILGLIIFSSCGSESSSSDNDQDKKLGALAYTVLEQGTLEHSTSQVVGVGSIAILDPTSEKDNSYSWVGSLKEGGKLALIANADTSLENGIKIEFERLGSVLHVVAEINQQKHDISNAFESIDAGEDLSFQLDIHNSEQPAHILIWKSDVSSFEEDTALFNSEDDVSFEGIGSGNIWGFSLSNATLSSTSVSEVKFEEE